MAESRFRVMHLDEMEAIPWDGTGPTWRPVRAHLGIRAFGTAAFTAAQAGEELIEPHTELEARRQQELYVVLRGRASFTVDGEPVDAEAGTFVFVGDPAVHRAAVAAESGTSVLVIGGEPTFTPSGHEYMNRVRARLPADPRRLAAAVCEAPELADEGRSDGIANLLENAGSHGTNVRSPP